MRGVISELRLYELWKPDQLECLGGVEANNFGLSSTFSKYSNQHYATPWWILEGHKREYVYHFLSFISSEPFHLVNLSLLMWVNFDLSLTFFIGPNVDATCNFAHWFWTQLFFGILSAEAEEPIGCLGQNLTHDKAWCYIFVFLALFILTCSHIWTITPSPPDQW